MRNVIRLACLFSILGLVLLVPTQVWAQRTGDHIVPSIETVCDDDPFSFGLCNAYCEALDCDSETPLGTPRACGNLLTNYMKKSGGQLPPCSCSCSFDVEADFVALVALGDAEVAPPPIDLDTLNVYCDSTAGPNDENVFVAEAFQNQADLPDPDNDTAQGVQLFYWVTEEPYTCNELGGGVDETGSDTLYWDDWSYGPWIENHFEVSQSEAGGCANALNYLCAATE